MKREIKIIIFKMFFIVLVFASPVINADVILLNPGGGREVMIASGGYIGGSFFGDFPSAVPVPPSDPPPTEPSDPSAPTIPVANIVVTPSWNASVGINIGVGTTRDETINVTNIGTETVTATLTHTFGDHLQVLRGEDTLAIAPGETKIFNIRFIAGNEAGTVAGIITISGKNILTSLDISTLLLLFDSNIVVLNENYIVQQGEKLNTLVTLIPMGDPSRLDVTLSFRIMDYSNRIYLTKSETLLITDYMQVKRDFDTGMLPEGNYIVALELIYPGGVAPSSAHFIVVEREIPKIFGKILLFLIILFLLIVIATIIFLIVKKIREEEQEYQKQIQAFSQSQGVIQ